MQGISGPQRFQIHKAYGAPDRLPSAHTWWVNIIYSLFRSLRLLQTKISAYWVSAILIPYLFFQLLFSFNQLDLPEYTSKEQLQERLLLAIHEASEGFGFGWPALWCNIFFFAQRFHHLCLQLVIWRSDISFLVCLCVYICVYKYLPYDNQRKIFMC